MKDHDTGAVLAAAENKPKIKVPASPHMPAEGVAYLKGQLNAAACYLEYGSGGSTRFAARLGVPSIYSVESDVDFAEAVKAAVVKDTPDANLHMHIGDVGKTGDLGFPASKGSCALWPDYAIKIWDIIDAAGESPDIVLVDGRFRVACFLASLLRAAPGTMILFDDYVGRETRYAVVEKYVPVKEFRERCAVFEVPDSLPTVAIAMDLARYSVVPA